MKQTITLLLIFCIFSNLALYAQRTGEVTRDGETWTARVNDSVVYTGGDIIFAIQSALNNLTVGRTVKETVNVRSSGSTGSHAWEPTRDIKAINMPSFSTLNFHGNTVHVNDAIVEDDIVPIRARSVRDIEVRNMRITGNPRYGIWIFGSQNVILDSIHISIPEAVRIGLGIRFEHRNNVWNRNVSLDNIFVENTRTHAVEFWDTDSLTIGRLVTRNTGGCGLLLNRARNVRVQLVDAYRANFGGGYAGLRFANGCGPNVVIEKVIARNCGRGVFSVSGSHGITINEVDIMGSTNQGILIEDTQNMTINGGVVKNSASQGVRITSRSGTAHHESRNVTIQNLRVYDDRVPRVQTHGIQETLPRTNNNRILNNDLRDGGSVADLFFQGPGTIAEGNILTPVSGITVTSPADTTGFRMQMAATIAPVNASSAVTWSVDSTAIATISATGLLTAVSNGTVVVTATSVSTPTVSGSKTITINIVPVESITVTSPADTAGTTLQMAATVVPVNASNPAVTWSVNNPAIATISATGLLTAVSNGTVEVTATSVSTPTVSGSKTITIVVPVASISLTSPNDTIAGIGGTMQMTPLVAPVNAFNPAVTWSVNNPAIATISATGLVTAVAPGSVVVTATSVSNPTVSGSKTITIVVPVASINVTSPNDTIAVIGGTMQMTAAVAPVNATNPAVTWSVSNQAIATISATGLVTAVAPGSVVVTATSVSNPTVSGSKTIVVFIPVGIPSVGTAFTLYPIPVESQLFISSSVAIERVEVLSIVGRTLISAAPNGSNAIDMSALPAGTYIVRVHKVNGDVVIRTIIKN